MIGFALLAVVIGYAVIRASRRPAAPRSFAPGPVRSTGPERAEDGGPIAGWMLGHQLAHGRTDFPGDPLPGGHLGSARDLAFWGGLIDEADDEEDGE